MSQMNRSSFRTNQGSKKQEVKEANIQVVLRCRGLNKREAPKRKKDCEFSVDPLKSQIRSLKEHGKTYTFDRVFGEKATQNDVFKEIVAPMLVEVLSGYNCSILAYGMTGTGKTYTMEGGDPTVTPMMVNGLPSLDAGIIPRTLIELFNSLAKFSEYSVKLSFIELYNEQPRDLLSGENSSDQIKIYDDSKKGGVVIQNLEEVLLRDAMHGIHSLQQGSEKRRKAVTNYNARSSRSHCVFTITTHIKETTTAGEELLKVGKLNLVDLAGSENIGRSGAEDAQAKEAGSINKSLLTLGRVIDKLVSDASHVPYRDSNLTRILQDSLGGRTKTCIIATIAPGKNSYDETLSTLEYAHRAKQIKNKPEINQKLAKMVLLKEYVDQIERLKADLQATRDKNGVYLTPESYRDVINEVHTLKSQRKELYDAVKQREKAIHELYEKISRKELVEMSNRKALNEFQTAFLSMASGLEATINKSKSLEVDLNDAINNKLLTFTDQAQKNLSQSLESIEEGLQQFDHNRQEFEKMATDQNISLKDVCEGQRRFFQEYRDNIFEAQKNLEANCESTAQDFRQEMNNYFAKVQICHDKIHEETAGLVKDTQAYIQSGEREINIFQNTISDAIHLQSERRNKIAMEFTQFAEKFNNYVKKETDSMTAFARGSSQSFEEILALNMNHMNHIRGRYEKAQEQLTSLIQDEPRDLLLNKFESIGSNVKTYLDASRSVTNAATLTLATKNRSADEIFARVRQDQTQSLDRLSDDIGKVYADMRIPLVNVQDGILNSLVPFENLAREKANNTQIIHDDAISYIQQERNEINLLVTQNVKADIPTGTTPRKNDYNYSETWSSTEESSFPSPLRPSTPLSSTLTEINIPDNIDITSTNSKKRTYSRMPMPLKRLKISSDVFEVDEQ